MAEEHKRIITLTTDFGTRDHYVASMKAAIWAVNPDANIVDISHDVPAHDILAAGFILRCAYKDFPTRTVHVCVVDPGVGTPRKPISASTEEHYFVGPDNGVFSFVYDVDPPTRVHGITEEHYQRESGSNTFHGRDIFAPAAAWITRGVDIGNFGESLDDFKRIDVPKAKRTAERTVQGLVIHVDRFGNLISSIHQNDVRKMWHALGGETPLDVKVGEHATTFQKTYMGGAEGPLSIIGSSGFLEIALPRKGAAKTLGVKRGDPVTVEFQS